MASLNDLVQSIVTQSTAYEEAVLIEVVLARYLRNGEASDVPLSILPALASRRLGLELLQSRITGFRDLLLRTLNEHNPTSAYSTAADLTDLNVIELRRLEVLEEWYDQALTVQNLQAQRTLVQNEAERIQVRLSLMSDPAEARATALHAVEEQISSLGYLALSYLHQKIAAFEFWSLTAFAYPPTSSGVEVLMRVRAIRKGVEDAILQWGQSSIELELNGQPLSTWSTGCDTSDGDPSLCPKRAIVVWRRSEHPESFRKLIRNGSCVLPLSVPNSLRYFNVRMGQAHVWLLGNTLETTPGYGGASFSASARQIGPTTIVDAHGARRRFSDASKVTFDHEYTVDDALGFHTIIPPTNVRTLDEDFLLQSEVLLPSPYGLWNITSNLDAAALEQLSAIRLELDVQAFYQVGDLRPDILWSSSDGLNGNAHRRHCSVSSTYAREVMQGNKDASTACDSPFTFTVARPPPLLPPPSLSYPPSPPQSPSPAPPFIAPPPFVPVSFSVEVTVSIAPDAASVSAEELISAVESLAAGTTTAASAIIMQEWEVNFELGGQEEATLAVQLQAACQRVSPDCVLVSEGSSRRHMESDSTAEVATVQELQTSAGTARLRRSLTTGPLDAEIANLVANSGVLVTSTNFIGAHAALVISQQGSVVEAQQLRSGSLAPNSVRATIAARLGLSASEIEVSVEESLFPPMPPPSLPPSPPASPPSVPSPPASLSPSLPPPQSPAVALLPASLPPPVLPASRFAERGSAINVAGDDDLLLAAGVSGGVAAGLALMGVCICLYKRKTKRQLFSAGGGAKTDGVQVTITHETFGSSGHPNVAEGDVTAPPEAVPEPSPRVQQQQQQAGVTDVKVSQEQVHLEEAGVQKAASPEQYRSRVARAKLANSASTARL
jgi:hypothetical protein